ncbi:MAG TPA: long-chain fatty acid--CoA ligase [Ignavibacteria bacterium]|nr:long-chain fatty acid--CoA ligase [Ignavibacteria bacterium]
MPLLKECKTIPELFNFLTTEYGPKSNGFVMKYKVDGKYTGITYEEFREETETFSLGLASLGFKKDEKIAIISENRPEWIYSDMAILALGGLDVPLYPSLTAHSIEFILNNSDSKGIIVSNKFQLNKILKIRDKCKSLEFIIVFNEIDDMEDDSSIFTFKQIQEKGKAYRIEHPTLFADSIPLADEDDLCTIIYTSGTTGEPKGVMLTHKNILSNSKAALEVLPITDEDVWLSYLPLSHIFERMTAYYAGFASGGTMCFAESIEKIATNLVEVRPTLMTTVPRLFERMYARIIKRVESQPKKKQKIFYWAVNVNKQYYDLKKQEKSSLILNAKHKLAEKLVCEKLRALTGGRLRFFVSGGAALPRELAEFFEAIGILIIEGYGLTESSPVIAANKPDDYQFGCVGKIMPNLEVKIAYDGEILVKGPSIMKGYYKNKKETDKVLKDGWLYTGDIGVFDARGFLVITDRKKHLFKTSGGKYIAPTPIENLFSTSKYIDQFVVIGDRRMFLSALIVPDYEAIKEYADTNNIKYQDEKELIANDEIYKLIEKDMTKFQKQLANYERVRKFVLLDKPFTIESGEITPSLKVKRKVLEQRYEKLIDSMYAAHKV